MTDKWDHHLSRLSKRRAIDHRDVPTYSLADRESPFELLFKDTQSSLNKPEFAQLLESTPPDIAHLATVISNRAAKQVKPHLLSKHALKDLTSSAKCRLEHEMANNLAPLVSDLVLFADAYETCMFSQQDSDSCPVSFRLAEVACLESFLVS